MAETVFRVKGPFDVPLLKFDKGGRCIDDEQVDQFWKTLESKEPKMSLSRGCYIFALRNSRGMRPIYVGRTIKSDFRFEAFHPTKLHIYNKILLAHKGTPVLFFIATKNGIGVAPHIELLETFLIQSAQVVNPKHLKNIQNKKLRWCIDGVLRGEGGPPTKPAKLLKRMLQLGSPPKVEHRQTEDISGHTKAIKTRAAKSASKTKPKARAKVAKSTSTK